RTPAGQPGRPKGVVDQWLNHYRCRPPREQRTGRTQRFTRRPARPHGEPYKSWPQAYSKGVCRSRRGYGKAGRSARLAGEIDGHSTVKEASPRGCIGIVAAQVGYNEETMTANTERIRSTAGITGSIQTLEGGGFPVRRPFPKSALSEFDPFLLLDEMGPVNYRPGQAKGAPDHPHRGFETVTYVLAGRMEHKDSQGHSGQLRPGDVQWMTAGAGVGHSEMPEREFLKSGGLMHGFQLWVNLPARDKMMKPRYQEIPGARIPVARSDDGLVTVRVVAGESLGSSAVIETRTPITYLHITV